MSILCRRQQQALQGHCSVVPALGLVLQVPKFPDTSVCLHTHKGKRHATLEFAASVWLKEGLQEAYSMTGNQVIESEKYIRKWHLTQPETLSAPSA